MAPLRGTVDQRVLHVERMGNARPKRQQYTVPPSPMNVASESLMFWLARNPESPVVGKPRVARQLIAPATGAYAGRWREIC